jgi:hypothetical protein
VLGLSLFVGSLAAAIISAGDTGCLQRDSGRLHVVDANLSDCTIREAPSMPREPRARAGGVFVADAKGRILGRSAGLLGDRVMWISDGMLFVGASRTGTDFVLLYQDDDCEGRPYAEVGEPHGASYSNLAMPVRGRTGTLEAFVFDGGAESIVPRSVWTGSGCAKPDGAERLVRPVRSIGPYPSYTPPFSLAER